jgi:hypothetical protein
VASEKIDGDAARIIDAISAALTPEGLLQLNTRSVDEQASAAIIARDWLAETALDEERPSALQPFSTRSRQHPTSATGRSATSAEGDEPAVQEEQPRHDLVDGERHHDGGQDEGPQDRRPLVRDEGQHRHPDGDQREDRQPGHDRPDVHARDR